LNTVAISFRMIRTPWSRVVWKPCLLWERACSGPQRWRGRGVRGLSLVLQTPLPPGSHRCPVNWPVARKAEGAHWASVRECPPTRGEPSPRDGHHWECLSPHQRRRARGPRDSPQFRIDAEDDRMLNYHGKRSRLHAGATGEPREVPAEPNLIFQPASLDHAGRGSRFREHACLLRHESQQPGRRCSRCADRDARLCPARGALTPASSGKHEHARRGCAGGDYESREQQTPPRHGSKSRNSVTIAAGRPWLLRLQLVGENGPWASV
jgi:hypothetical protein